MTVITKLTIDLFLVLSFVSSQSADLRAEAQSLFLEGAALIEQNHHESMSGTKEGLERGIELVQRAVELGYPDIQVAYLKLASALNSLAHAYYGDQEEVFEDLSNYRKLIYRRLLELDPNSAEILSQNAVLAEDPQEQEALFRRAVEADPKHAESNYLLGMILIARGESDEGIPLARRGVENSGAIVLQSYGSDLLEALKGSGLDAEAKDFEKRFKELLREWLWIPGPPHEESNGSGN